MQLFWEGSAFFPHQGWALLLKRALCGAVRLGSWLTSFPFFWSQGERRAMWLQDHRCWVGDRRIDALPKNAIWTSGGGGVELFNNISPWLSLQTASWGSRASVRCCYWTRALNFGKSDLLIELFFFFSFKKHNTRWLERTQLHPTDPTSAFWQLTWLIKRAGDFICHLPQLNISLCGES